MDKATRIGGVDALLQRTGLRLKLSTEFGGAVYVATLWDGPTVVADGHGTTVAEALAEAFEEFEEADAQRADEEELENEIGGAS